LTISAREAEDDSKEHRENANAAENSTHVTPMDEDVLDLYGSGDDSELRGVDVAESTAAATSLLRSESLVSVDQSFVFSQAKHLKMDLAVATALFIQCPVTSHPSNERKFTV